MNEWTTWHDLHVDKIELVAGIDCWIWAGGRTSKGTHGRVRFSRPDGARYSEYAHRASYIAFRGQPSDGEIVCHKCGVGLCVRPTHLYAGTHATNGKDAADMGVGTAALTYQNAFEVRLMYQRGDRLQDIADRFGVAYGTIYPIVMGRAYRHAPFPDNYTFGKRIRRPLSDDNVREIIALLSAGERQSAIAKRFGIREPTVSRINTGSRYGGRNLSATKVAETPCPP